MGPYPLRGSQEAVTAFDTAVERWLHHDGGVLAAARDAVRADPSFASLLATPGAEVRLAEFRADSPFSGELRARFARVAERLAPHAT
jgi:hypothetical protein